MTRKNFISNFTDFIQRAVRLNKKALKYGLLSLENELEDLDEEFFKQGLRYVVDGTSTVIIEEILSNKISFEKNKYVYRYKTIQKRAVLGIQAGINNYILIHILFSNAGLNQKEQRKIELLLYRDDSTEDNSDEVSENQATIVIRYDFSSAVNWGAAIDVIENEFGDNLKGVDFGRVSNRTIAIYSDCPNIKLAEQLIMDNGGKIVEELELDLDL